MDHKFNSYLKHSPYNDILARKRLTIIVGYVSSYAQKAQRDNISILDIGCGIGGISFPLSYLGYEVTGVDIDIKSIEACNNKNNFPNAKFLAGDIEFLELPHHFDIVVCSEVLEHLTHPESLLKIINKRLKPGGVAILTIPNGYSVYELIFSRLFGRVGIGTLFHKLPNKLYRTITGSPSPYHSMNIFCNHVQFFTLKRFRKMLNTSGFQVEDTKNQSLGLFLDWKCFRPLRWSECKLADFVPHTLAGGWVFVIRRQGESPDI